MLHLDVLEKIKSHINDHINKLKSGVNPAAINWPALIQMILALLMQLFPTPVPTPPAPASKEIHP